MVGEEAGEGLRWFPLFQNIEGRFALIVGGGSIALRRTRTLLRFACRLRIIAERPRDELAALALEHRGRIVLEQRPFCPGDCAAAGEAPVFAVAATNNRGVNRAVALECAAAGIPVSVADCKEESTFYFPAIITNRRVVSGVSSGGLDHKAVKETAARIRVALEAGARE